MPFSFAAPATPGLAAVELFEAAYGELSAVLEETVSGIEVVKANVRERYEWDNL